MKTWFITGASRGFGLRIAKLALEQGDNVVATARRAEAVIEALGNRERLLALPLDVTDETQAKAAAAAAVEAFGSIDVLLNNAGFGLLGAVEEASAEDVERVYRTNVFGLLNVTRAVLPTMRAQRAGRILNISSIGGYRAGPGFGVYWPAMMLRKTAAAYLDMPEAAFEREVISARLPMPILFGGKERWSREQIDEYLSNLTDGGDWRATSNLYAGSAGGGNWREKSPVYNKDLPQPENGRRKK